MLIGCQLLFHDPTASRVWYVVYIFVWLTVPCVLDTSIFVVHMYFLRVLVHERILKSVKSCILIIFSRISHEDKISFLIKRHMKECPWIHFAQSSRGKLITLNYNENNNTSIYFSRFSQQLKVYYIVSDVRETIEFICICNLKPTQALKNETKMLF